MRRSSMTISPITSSATLRVFENGALKTGMPALAGRVQINLIRPHAEASHRGQAIGPRKGYPR